MIKSRYVQYCHTCRKVLARKINNGQWHVILTGKKRRTGLNIYCGAVCKERHYRSLLKDKNELYEKFKNLKFSKHL